MKITLEASEIHGTVNDVPARLWRGRTESGIEIYAWIAYLRETHVCDSADLAHELDAVLSADELPPIAIAIDRIRQDP